MLKCALIFDASELRCIPSLFAFASFALMLYTCACTLHRFAKMLPVEAAVARAAAGKAKAETRGQSVLPDEEPLTTNAARLLKELQEDQALSRANFQNAGKAEDDAAFLANFSGGDNEAAEAGGLDEDGAEKKVECSFFDKFVAKGVTWIDLETRFGGDPDHLPLLRKLTKQVIIRVHVRIVGFAAVTSFLCWMLHVPRLWNP